jgi:hypothetical protein
VLTRKIDYYIIKSLKTPATLEKVFAGFFFGKRYIMAL